MRAPGLSLLFLLALASSAGAATGDACRFDHGVFVHGRRDSGLVALTFDACPTSHVPPFAADIVEELEQARVPATFFVSGRWAEAHPAELHRLASNPLFEIAMHGHRHRHMDGASREVVDEEIESGRAALTRNGAAPQPLFRPPYGEHPSLMQEVARGAGVTPVLWDVEPGDPDPHATAPRIEHVVLEGVKGGSIVVMHVNGRGVGTAAALPAVIRGIEARGLRFATVSELLQACAQAEQP